MKEISRCSRERFYTAYVAAAVVAVLCGCGTSNKKASPAAATHSGSSTNRASILVAPTTSGKVASVNLQARFAVLMFPIGQVPPPDTRMVVYHDDAKTGEVKITGPAQDNLTVGDIVLGTVRENDDVRSE